MRAVLTLLGATTKQQYQRVAALRQTINVSRPLCPYPAVARYTGKGSIDEAANFACAVQEAPSPRRTSSGQ